MFTGAGCELIMIMWRAGLRVQEALALTEGDLDQGRAALLVPVFAGLPPLRCRIEAQAAATG